MKDKLGKTLLTLLTVVLFAASGFLGLGLGINTCEAIFPHRSEALIQKTRQEHRTATALKYEYFNQYCREG